MSKLIFAAFSMLLLSAVFISCGKNDAGKIETTSGTEKTDNTETEASSNESSDDLTSVDYKVFYDELAPEGEWIQVDVNEIKSEPSANANPEKKNIKTASLLDILTGVTPAYADDEKASVAFVWRPTVAVNDASWQPYKEGQWIYTENNGWYFKANTDPINTTHHYGRWWNSPALGWVWLPGKVWSPAWVTMRESNNMVAWAPLPPNAYIVNNTVAVTDVNDDYFILVDKKDFARPDMVKYKYMYKENKNKIMIKEMVKLDGPMMVNKTVINKGPQLSVIESAGGQKVKVYKLDFANNRNDSKFADDKIVVFKPGLKEFKGNDKKNVSSPIKFITSDDAKRKVQLSNDGDYKKLEDLNKKNDDKSGKRNNGNDVIKLDDNDNNRHGYDNGKGNDKKKSNEDNGNDKHKQKGKDK